MSNKNLLDERGILLEEVLEKMSSYGNSVSCECPKHLVDLLKQAKEFTAYQDRCSSLQCSEKLTTCFH